RAPFAASGGEQAERHSPPHVTGALTEQRDEIAAICRRNRRFLLTQRPRDELCVSSHSGTHASLQERASSRNNTTRSQRFVVEVGGFSSRTISCCAPFSSHSGTRVQYAKIALSRNNATRSQRFVVEAGDFSSRTISCCA